jgi:hypothetical protein
MTDRELRRAERDASGGEPDAEARLLVARVRAGTLAPERLELAAAAGHPDSRRALGWSGAPPTLRRVDDLVAALSDPGAVHALALAVRRLAPAEPDPISVDRIDAARAWCECPCPAHAEEAYRLSQLPEFALGLRGPYVEGALRVAEAAYLAGHGGDARAYLGVVLRPIREGAEDEAALAASTRDELVTWALGAQP